MNNTSPNGWQSYLQGQNQQYPQGPFNQNGGVMGMRQEESQFVGRFINRIDEVMPREVPMDGRPAIFPTQTLEEIYLKAWDRDGRIKTFRYILDPTQIPSTQNSVQQQDMGSMILERLDQLEQRLGDSQNGKPANRRTSKGGENNAEP